MNPTPYQQFTNLMHVFHDRRRPDYTNFAGASVPLTVFPNPRCLTAALKESIDRNVAGYVSPLGTPLIRERIAEYENARMGHQWYTEKKVGLIPGSITGALGYVLDQLFGSGPYARSDGKLVISVPNYWLPLEYMERKLPCVPVRKIHARPENGFLPSVSEIVESFSDKTQALFLCNPLNPTGRVHTQQELEAIVHVARQKGIFIVSDEACYDLMHDATIDASVSRAAAAARYDRVIILRTWSKDRGRPDMNLGYVLGPSELLAERERGCMYDDPGRFFLPFIHQDMRLRLFCLQKNPLLENEPEASALAEYRALLHRNRRKFKQNTASVVDALRSCSAVDVVIMPQNGFTVFFHLVHRSIPSGYRFVHDLFQATGVSSLSGSTFGMDGGNWGESDPTWIRFSVACAPKKPASVVASEPKTYLDDGLSKVCSYLSRI